jgi:sec-independent protein translocase protein TatC
MTAPFPPPHSDGYFDATRMPLDDHLEELRRHLWRALAGLGLSLALAFALDLVGYLTETRIGIGRPMLDLIRLPVEQELEKFQDRRFEQAVRTLEGPAGGPPLETVIELDMNAAARDLAALLGLRSPPVAAAPRYRPVPVRLAGAGLRPLLEKIRPTLERKPWLATMSVTEGMMVYVQVTLVCALVLASPWVFWQLWSFVAAGLYPHERRYVFRYLPFSLGLFVGGVLVCQFLVVPKAVEALLGFNEWLGLEPDLRLGEWLGFALMLPLVFGLSFQTPLVMVLLQRLGVLSVESYRGKRRVAWFLLAVFAAVITPSVDAYSMLLLWVPLGLLYELGIVLCRLSRKRSVEQLQNVPEPGEAVGV